MERSELRDALLTAISDVLVAHKKTYHPVVELTNAVLNAITASGFVIVRRDDLEAALTAITDDTTWSFTNDEDGGIDVMQRLRAAVQEGAETT